MLAIPTIFIVVCATVVIVRFVPGDVVEFILVENPYSTEEDPENLRAQLGLDQPVVVQFGRYSADLLRGELGDSPWTGRAVTTELKSRIPISLELGLFALLLGLFVVLPVGIISAIRQDTVID